MEYATEYLPGLARDRIDELIAAKGYHASDLAKKIGVGATTITRIINGSTAKINSDILNAIADEFNVTTDFILGRTDIPEKTTYRIEQLGLSVKAAQNIYSGKVNPVVLNALLESPKFCELTYSIDFYFEEIYAKGFAVYNQIIDTASYLMRKNANAFGDDEKSEAIIKGSRDIQAFKQNVYRDDLERIQSQFMSCIRELKKNMDSQLAEVKKATDSDMKKFAELMEKNTGKPMHECTPDDITEAIADIVKACGNPNDEEMEQLKNAVDVIFALFANQGTSQNENE